MSDIDNICDQILRFARDNKRDYWENPLDDISKIFGKSVSSSDFRVALDRLKNNKPPLLEQKGSFGWYYRTNEGIKFINDGGFSMKNRIEQTEKIENEQDRILSRQVNQSTIDTNTSIQTLNDKTKCIYTFQRWSTMVTIIVAIAAVVVAWLAYSNDSEKNSLSQMLQQQILKVEQSQKQTDSLKELLLLERVKNPKVTPKDSVAK